MHVSRSTKPLTNHSWQVWRSIYNNHIEVKISPTMIWVHREQATLINAQGHLCKGTRQSARLVPLFEPKKGVFKKAQPRLAFGKLKNATFL